MMKMPKIDATTSRPTDCSKYFSSLSLMCLNVSFGEVIIPKITFRLKEEKDTKYQTALRLIIHKDCCCFINVELIKENSL